MSNGSDTLTHKDIARALGVSETTIKSYRRKFPLHFPLHSRGKPLRFAPEALDVARLVRQGFLADLSVEEIRASLDEKFQRIEPKRNPSIPVDSLSASAARPDSDSLQAIQNSLSALLEAQQHANRRLDALQELFADFLTLHLSREDAFSQGLVELKRSWNRHLEKLAQMAPAQAAPPPPNVEAPGRPKRVLVRNAYGQRQEYVISSEPHVAPPADGATSAGAEQPHLADTAAETPHSAVESKGYTSQAPAGPSSGPAPAPLPGTPPETLLQMPLVVRTGADEYLGVAGKTEGAFSLQDLLDLVRRAYSPPLHFSSEWQHSRKGGGGFRLHLEQEEAIRPRMYALEVEPARTPRGNEVALLTDFEIQGSSMPPANIYAFIRQMKQES